MMRHDDGDLKAGDRPRFRRIPSAPVIVLTAANGEEIV